MYRKMKYTQSHTDNSHDVMLLKYAHTSFQELSKHQTYIDTQHVKAQCDKELKILNNQKPNICQSYNMPFDSNYCINKIRYMYICE